MCALPATLQGPRRRARGGGGVDRGAAGVVLDERLRRPRLRGHAHPRLGRVGSGHAACLRTQQQHTFLIHPNICRSTGGRHAQVLV